MADGPPRAHALVRLAPVAGQRPWTSDWIEPGFDVVEVVPSWNADMPRGATLAVEIQGRTAVGLETGWYRLAEWAYDDATLARASVPGQEDALGAVDVDTFRAADALQGYRVRLTPSGGATVRSASAVASSAPAALDAPSTPLSAEPVEIDVPPLSQSVHAGTYPEYDGGGASWCSPTATAMVLARWGLGPEAPELAWVDSACADACVVHAARFTYDAAYGGCGNWAFNVAYAGCLGADAFVTRLGSLRDAEMLLRAGVPLVASIAAGPGELDGYPHPHGTEGHLVVLAGLTATGDVVVDDPAAPSNEEVRRVYARGQLERGWLGGSRGTVYVIVPRGTALPPSPGTW